MTIKVLHLKVTKIKNKDKTKTIKIQKIKANKT
jgi:hypothetical protein